MKKITLSLLFLVCIYALQAQTIQELSFLTASPVLDMKYIDNHLAVSLNGLSMYDVSNPNQPPALVSHTTYPGGNGYDVAVQTHFAYLAAGNNGEFSIYDVSDFSAPVLKGTTNIPATAFYLNGEIEPGGPYVYLSGITLVYVINVANPSLPYVVDSVTVPDAGFGGAGEMSIDQHSLFVRTATSTDIFDISDPAHPVFTGAIQPSHPNNSGISADTIQHRIFLPWLDASHTYIGFDTYDVSNPNSPQFLFADSTFFGSGNFGEAAFSYANDVLYLSHSATVNAFAVSSQAHLFLTAFTGSDVTGSIVSIDVKDSVFYTAKDNGLEVLEFTPGNGPVCEPTAGLIATNIQATSAKLTWFEVPGADGYLIKIRENGGNQQTILSSMSNFKKVKSLTPATTYTFSVKTVCNAADHVTSVWSAPSSFTTALFKLPGEPSAEPSLTVYPDPVQDESTINVSLTEPAQVLLQLFTVDGKQVLTIANENLDAGNHSFNFSRNTLEAGVYLLRLKTGTTEETTKVIVL